MAEEFKSVIQVLEAFGVDTIQQLHDSIDRKNINASHNLRQSVNYRTTVAGSIIRFQLDFSGGPTGADYATFVDRGRGATKNKGGKKPSLYDNLTGLTGWISQKGITPKMTVEMKRTTKTGVKAYTRTFKDIAAANRNLAYLIARKIHRRGTKATRFYSEVVTDTLIGDLKTDIRAAFKRDILIELRKA